MGVINRPAPYRECEKCGSHLDHGEICDCTKEKEVFDFNSVKGDYSRYSDSLKRNFETTAQRHMNCIENPETRKKYEPASVKYDKENHRHVVTTKGSGKMYYSLDGSWY